MADIVDQANERAEIELDRALRAMRVTVAEVNIESRVCEDCEDDSGQCGKACEFYPKCLAQYEWRTKREAQR